jgi:rhamnose utilization protein RhaD (predicted bifunctional aldolase and dehydrogenase)
MEELARVKQKALTLSDLAGDLVAEAARSLLAVVREQAKGLPLPEIQRRFDAAIKALRGDRATAAGVSHIPQGINALGNGDLNALPCGFPSTNQSQVGESLIEMAQTLGSRHRDYIILGEGNAAGRCSKGTFLVTASASSLNTIKHEELVEMDLPACLGIVDHCHLSDDEIKAGLLAARTERSNDAVPSVGTFEHAVLLDMLDAQFIAHTHPTSVNAILCSRKAREALAGRIFPDEVVCCGIAPCVVDYADPGLPLARAFKAGIKEFRTQYNCSPKVFCLINHGIFVAGASPADVVATTDMFVKVCEILYRTHALGGPQYLAAKSVERLAVRGDERYRRTKMGLS